ncbi:hypothetical protein HUJ05_004315 [Dendroctonus ponderosae]|nr:hypothetical protein HUJ05_004315 [Dendroctonus ponderosae]
MTKQVNRIDASGVSLVQLAKKVSTTRDVIIANLRTELSKIDPRIMGNNFLVIVSYELAATIMECAKELNMVNTQTQWLYVISDTNSSTKSMNRFKTFLNEGDNIAFIYNTTDVKNGGTICHTEESITGLMKALDSAIMEEFQMASQISEEEWEAIRPTKNERRKYLLEKIQKYLSDYGTCDNCTKWTIEAGETWGREYQMLDEATNAELLAVGTWRPSDGPNMIDALFPHVAHGFRRKLLPLVTFHNPPWQILKTNSTGDVVEYGGIVFNIIKELSKNLNFTFNVATVKPQSLLNASTLQSPKGDTDSSANFNGNSYITTYRVPHSILEMVHNKSAALGACAFTVTEENQRVINFTDPISIQAYTFLAARPRELSRALLFISPFRGDTWLCLSATIISMGPVLFYIHKLSPVYEYKGVRCKGGLATIQNCIWYMYGALLQQGGMHLPYADSARIIVGSWWLVVLVIGTTYCGNLVAYLTFPKIEVPMTTIDDVLAHKEMVSWSYAKNTLFEARLHVSS